MKAQVFNLNSEKVMEIDLPSQFSEPIRTDLIKRDVLALQSNRKQPYGSDPEAGKKYSAKLSRRRRDYKTGYGHGISRIPRKVMWHRGRQFGWVGAFAPGTVGGRRAHPPKSEKDLIQKINKKEKRKAIRSAIAATIDKELIKKRGFIFTEKLPLVMEDSIENISKTKELKSLLIKLGLKEDIKRTSKKIIRAGKGKLRGRKYKRKIGPLIVTSKECNLKKAVSNIPGIDICEVKNLNSELLAPGAVPGRFIIWSLSAIDKLGKENLFK